MIARGKRPQHARAPGVSQTRPSWHDPKSVRRLTVSDGQVIGVVFEPEPAPSACAVVLGGSGGGLPEGLTQRVAQCGVTAFGVAYFGARGLPGALVEVPLEPVERAIELFRARYANGRQVGLVGSSKGAELALLVASRVGGLVGPVVAAAPSSVSWYGLERYGRPAPGRSSWKWRGAPVPFLPYAAGAAPTYTQSAGIRVDGCYQPSRYAHDQLEKASVAVEGVVGPLLVLAGDDDHMWPSAAMAEQIVERRQRHGRDGDTNLVIYRGAGHTFLNYQPKQVRGPSRWDFGGDAKADCDACSEAWPRISAFLQG